MTGPGPGSARAILVARLLGAGLTLAMLVVLGRVVQLQVAPGAKLREHMYERTSVRSIPAVRGDLTDRRGRLLSTTRFGYRAFVDPATFSDAPDLDIPVIAEAIGADPERIASRILPRIETNRRRRAEAILAGDPSPSLIRYVSIGGILTDEQVERVRTLGIPGLHLEQRSVREYPGQDVAAALIGKVGIDHDGLLGAELSFDARLQGHDGSVAYVRDAMARPLWIDEGQFERPVRGEDTRLSIDLVVQQIAHQELSRGVEEADAAGGRIVVMDTISGEILAMVDLVREVPDAVEFPWEPIDPDAPRPARPEPGEQPRYRAIHTQPARDIHPALARNRCIEDVYEPGSTFKPFVWAVVTELGLATPEDRFNTGDGRWRTSYGRLIEDVITREEMTWTEVLVNSSNIGMAKGAERLTFDQLHDAVRRFGFGRPTGIGLRGEASGLVTSRESWNKYTQTSVAFGYEVAVTPVQMARAFSAFARPGALAGTLPPVRLSASDRDDPHVRLVDRVLPAEVSLLVRDALRRVADAMERKMAEKDPGESSWRYEIFGKSGTAEIPLADPPPGMRRPRGHKGYLDRQYNASFIAGAPFEDPRIVVLAVIDDPGPQRVASRTYYGSHVAGPVARRVIERTLSYMGVEPSPIRVAGAE